MCEQAKHVTSPQEMEYDVTMKTRTNICKTIGVHTKPLNGVSIRKNVSCGSFYNTEAEKSTSLIRSSCLEVVIFIFSFHSERALHIQKKSNKKSVHAYVLPVGLNDIKCCLVYFCVAFSRVLRN